MKISTRQICFIMLAYTAAAKLIIYPNILSVVCDRDLLFTSALQFLISGIIIWSLCFLCSKTDKTFYGLLEGSIGSIGAKIVFGLFAAFFMLAALLPICEQKQYVHNIFYDTVPSLGVFLPFFILSVYAGSKRLQNSGRCADICMPIFLVSMVIIFIMAFKEVEWSNFLPVLKTPAKKLLGGFTGTFINFVEPCWLLMFMGHFKYKKGDAAKITLSYAGGALIVLLFIAVYYGMYGSITSSRTFAIARTSLFFPAIESIGRIDLVILFALEIVMLFALILNIQLAVYSIVKCSGYEDTKVVSVAVNVILAVIVIFCDNYYHAIYELYFNWLWIVFLVFAIAVPLCSWFLKRRNA